MNASAIHDFTPGTPVWNRRAVELKPLDEASLRRLVPSAFATAPIASASKAYSFIPTTAVISALAEHGWQPFQAREQRVRKAEYNGFAKHVIRFSQPGRPLLNVGDAALQLVMTNGHNAATAYKFMGGVFRVACSNGLMIADGTVDSISLSHVGLDVADVIRASSRMIESAPAVEASIAGMMARVLSPLEAKALAVGAIALRYEDPADCPVKPEKLLEPRRGADSGNDLWRTFNRVQENLIRGGQRGFVIDEATGRTRRASTRAIKGIDADTRLNRGLWAMAEVLRAGGMASDILAAGLPASN